MGERETGRGGEGDREREREREREQMQHGQAQQSKRNNLRISRNQLQRVNPMSEAFSSVA